MWLARILCFIAASTIGLAADPFLGTWKLNTIQSKYVPGPAPRSLVMTWAAENDGVRIASTGIQAEGRPIRESYVAIYDGKERPKPGPWNFDAVINRQNSETEREDIFKRNGAVVGTAKIIVSQDGKTLTATWAFGEMRDVRVYDRQ